MTADERLNLVEEPLRTLQERVAELEQARATPAFPPVAAVPNLALLEQMRSRSGPPYEQGDMRGALTYAGAIHIDGLDYLWQIERPLPGLFTLAVDPLAQVLAALGSPARITLVRALLGGAHTSQQLQATLGGVSPGQLYHHLKELRAAGIIEQHGRSDYRIASSKVVPFLIIVAGAFDLLTDQARNSALEES